MKVVKTALSELNPWNELPVWAALMIKTTARGLALPERWKGWEWESKDVILVHASEYRYTVRRGAPWVV